MHRRLSPTRSTVLRGVRQRRRSTVGISAYALRRRALLFVAYTRVRARTHARTYARAYARVQSRSRVTYTPLSALFTFPFGAPSKFRNSLRTRSRRELELVFLTPS